MYVNHEISFSWMLTSAGFSFPKVHKRTVKRDEQGHVLLFFRSTGALTVCWALHNLSSQPALSTTITQILHAGLSDKQQQCNPSPSKSLPMELPPKSTAGTFPHLPLGLQEKKVTRQHWFLLLSRKEMAAAFQELISSDREDVDRGAQAEKYTGMRGREKQGLGGAWSELLKYASTMHTSTL